MLKWDFTKLSTDPYETHEYAISEAITDISFVTSEADIVFVHAEGTESRVVCYEHSRERHLVSVEDGKLTITVAHTKRWYDYIGIHFGSPKITVYLPAGQYGALSIKANTGDVDIPREFQFESADVSVSTGDVTSDASVAGQIKIKTSTGDITLQDVSAGSLDLTVSTGKVTASRITCAGDISVRVGTGKSFLTDVTCQNLTSSGNTGDITMKNVIATGRFSIARDTGDVTFDGCDAAEISVTTDTGDVKGTLLTEKTFFVETDTGRKDYPKSTTGGKCEITTDTGDVKISIKN